MVFWKNTNGDPIKQYEAIFANYDIQDGFNQTETSKLIQALDKIRTEGILICPFSNKIDMYYLFHDGVVCITSIFMQESKKAISITVSHDNLKSTYNLCKKLGFTVKD